MSAMDTNADNLPDLVLYLSDLGRARAKSKAWRIAHKYHSFISRVFMADSRPSFYEALGSYLEKDRSLIEALAAIYEVETDNRRTEGRGLVFMLPRWIYELLEEGLDFAEIVSRDLPPADAALLGVLSVAGLQAQGLKKLAATVRQMRTWKAKISGALVPFILVCGTFIAGMNWLGGDLFPQFEKTLPDPSALQGSMLYGPSLLISRHWTEIVSTMGAFMLSAWWFLPRWYGPSRSRVDWIWPLTAYRRQSEMWFIQALSVMLANGIRLTAALSEITKTASPYVRYGIEAAINNSDLPLGDAFLAGGRAWPSPKTCRQLRHHVTSDDPGAALERFAQEQIANFDRFISSATEIMQWSLGVMTVLVLLSVMQLSDVFTSSLKLYGA